MTRALALLLMATPAAACDAVVYNSPATHESVVRSKCVMIGTAVAVIMPAAEASGRVDHIAGAGKKVRHRHKHRRRH